MRRTILAALLATLILPASANAAFFPAEVIDGPNPDLVAVGDVDISRDGTGGVVYVRRDGGVPHIFFSALVDGAFGPPQRIDNGLAGASSQPVIGVSGNDRMAIAWVTDGSLFTAVKAKDATGFSAATLVAQGGVSHPSIDMSINGATYVSFSQSGLVRAARAERDSPTFTVLPGVLNLDAGRPGGDTETRRSRVVVSADGTALVVWGEAGFDGRNHVVGRRLFEQRVSLAPQDLTLPSVDGVPAGSAESPEVDIEDDSSYAQVVFRQETAGGPRTVMRRLVGSQFDSAVAIDGGWPSVLGPVVLTGPGEGMYALDTGGGVFAGLIFANKLNGGLPLAGGNGVTTSPVVAIGENEDSVVAWFAGSGDADASVRGRFFDGIEKVNAEGEVVLSRPDFGPVHRKGGIDAAASRAADVTVVFMQGGEGDRRLVAGVYDKPPSRVGASDAKKVRKLSRLAWGESLNLFGPVTYRVVVDGKQIGETRENQLIPEPGQIPDGTHRWQVYIRDRRGQEVVSRTRTLRVDNTPPTLRVSLSKKQRVVTVSVRAGDPKGAKPSGLSRVLVDWGDGKLDRIGTKASKRYPTTGTKRIRVKALDKAGNETIVRRSTRIG